ncbi:MAG: hypothetical protein E7610_08770 [Ruminococcaceae bacterium]|nr:hypothetical protein [Oscillospiraceae bacterium]
MEGARIGGVALLGLTALILLRPLKPEWAVFIRMAVAVVSVGVILTLGKTVLDFVSELTKGVKHVDGEAWSILLKALGIAVLTETAATICRDSGEGSLAGWVETAGKLEILLLAFPLIRTVMEAVSAILGG